MPRSAKTTCTVIQTLWSAVDWRAGPAIVPQIHTELAALLHRDGFAHVADAVGADTRG